jgi:ADP-ribose pyrophosphatase YjhB (NUDIX family)
MSRRHASTRAYGILVHQGAVALVRSSNPLHQPPLWWLPGGGIEFGESPEVAVEREFLEETGLRVASPRLFDVAADLRSRDNGDQVHTIRVIYEVDLAGGELTHEVHGTTDHAAWWPLEDVFELNLADYTRAALEELADRSA